MVHPKTVDGVTKYEVGVASKSFVPKFGPDLPPELTRENLKDYFLAKSTPVFQYLTAGSIID